MIQLLLTCLHFFCKCLFSYDIYTLKCRQGLHIVHVCTEMAPVTSNGSLASYVTGLSQALQEKGYFVEVVLPKYGVFSLLHSFNLY